MLVYLVLVWRKRSSYIVLPQIIGSTNKSQEFKKYDMVDDHYSKRKKQLLSAGQKDHYQTFKVLTGIGN